MEKKMEKKSVIYLIVFIISLGLTISLAIVFIPKLFFTLDIKVEGEGEVSVFPDNGGRIYFRGAKVNLTAEPKFGWYFDHWSGNVSKKDKSEESIIITINSNDKIKAHFYENPGLVLTISVVGEGTTDPSPGVYKYHQGDEATITAIPSSGWKFGHWSGDASGNQNPITVEMTYSDSDKDITAHFGNCSLTINTVGQGTTNPLPGIHYYSQGARVIVTAIPETGWSFCCWTGNATRTENPINLTMDSNKKITANFKSIPVPTTNSIFTMEFDEAQQGYNKGDKVYTQYDETCIEFVLRDKFGVFEGKYIYIGKKLTLDFYGYPSWYITFTDATHFTGVEAGKNNGGTYEWI